VLEKNIQQLQNDEEDLFKVKAKLSKQDVSEPMSEK